MYIWSCARFGRLGVSINANSLCREADDGHEIYVASPIAFTNNKIPSNIVKICTAGYHRVCVTSDGNLWTWGLARHGRLGIGDFNMFDADVADENERYTAEPIPVPVRGESFIDVANAAFHTLALTKKGQIWSWGCARLGILGIGDFDDLPHDAANVLEKYQSVPRMVNLPCRITQIACGEYHSLAVSELGDVWAWGCARFGVLGIGPFAHLSPDPEDEKEKFSAVPVKVALSANVHVVKVCCGDAHSVAVCSNGHVWTWGSARYGRLGIGNVDHLPSDPVSSHERIQLVPTQVKFPHCQLIAEVACGDAHNLALTVNGDVWAWGSARFGVLGIGDISCLPHDEMDVNEKFQSSPVAIPFDNRQITHVACGCLHSVVATAEGEVWAWGLSSLGRLGIGTNTTALSMCESMSIPGAVREKYYPVPVLIDSLPKTRILSLDRCSVIFQSTPRSGQALASQMAKLFDTMEFADLEIEFDCGRILLAHKCILSARTKVFSSMLSSQWKQPTGSRLHMKDCDYDIFNIVLKWVYCDELPCASTPTQQLMEIMLCADRFNLESLSMDVADILKTHLDPTNVLDIFQAAELANASILQATCIRYVRTNYGKCKKHKSFRSALATSSRLQSLLPPIAESTQKRDDCPSKTTEEENRSRCNRRRIS